MKNSRILLALLALAAFSATGFAAADTAEPKAKNTCCCVDGTCQADACKGGDKCKPDGKGCCQAGPACCAAAKSCTDKAEHCPDGKECQEKKDSPAK